MDKVKKAVDPEISRTLRHELQPLILSRIMISLVMMKIKDNIAIRMIFEVGRGVRALNNDDDDVDDDCLPSDNIRLSNNIG